ncbi:MAG: HAD-IIB family hydrolase [Gammaproteobacteria bacterium]|nr:HAD-IIB family hydrolase [Gammaproteobacteria bacterium]
MSVTDNDSSGVTICLLSIHGLIRRHHLELGRDADTGGQTKYVVDLARALARHPDVGRVHLVTRLIRDPAVGPDYAREEEQLAKGASIIRIPCGPDEYIPKEQLWDHLDSFTDNLMLWLQGQTHTPAVIHSHYADAGYVGVRLSNLLGVPLVHTGHSLGRDKRKRLLARGISREQISRVYNIDRRIDAEEEVLANADLVITSTRNEIEEQYGLYNYYDPARMVVIPPGTDLEQFRPGQRGEQFAFSAQVDRFLAEPDKPLILALSRADERKNIAALIEAFGESPELQEAANLLIIAGNRDDIRDLDSGPQAVLTDLLLLADAYDLYGRIALPKHHRPEDVPQIYRMTAARRGVFINPALTEPFGLTLLEAAASGLPLVATENGGPVDIIRNCKCGELIDPLDKKQMAKALLKYLGDESQWQRASANGIKNVRKFYSWQAHVEAYVSELRSLSGKYTTLASAPPLPRTLRYRDRALVTDLDQSLIGDPAALDRFLAFMRENRRKVSFVIATGRRVDSALALMKKHGIPSPDILITSLGTRIQYSQALTEDDLWAEHIDHAWSARRVKLALSRLPGLIPQEQRHQTPFKISYYYDDENAPGVEEINTLLRQQEITANVILSFGQFLDIIPARASKGQALRYAAQRLEIPLEQILVAGGSGADEDMIRGNTLAVVVANRHHEELSPLPSWDRIYFARQSYAAGILEAIEHYDFFGRCGAPDA